RRAATSIHLLSPRRRAQLLAHLPRHHSPRFCSPPNNTARPARKETTGSITYDWWGDKLIRPRCQLPRLDVNSLEFGMREAIGSRGLNRDPFQIPQRGRPRHALHFPSRHGSRAAPCRGAVGSRRGSPPYARARRPLLLPSSHGSRRYRLSPTSALFMKISGSLLFICSGLKPSSVSPPFSYLPFPNQALEIRELRSFLRSGLLSRCVVFDML
ncbi:unnamed protein product, partial [Urochloa humidicola]